MHKTKSTSTIMSARADSTSIANNKLVYIPTPPWPESVMLVAESDIQQKRKLAILYD